MEWEWRVLWALPGGGGAACRWMEDWGLKEQVFIVWGGGGGDSGMLLELAVNCQLCSQDYASNPLFIE